jgi:hypothetical protein
MDRLVTLKYPDNDHVAYAYNTRNLLRQISGGPSGSVISDITYQPSGQMKLINYGNGVRTTYDYDLRLRLTRLHTFKPGTGLTRGMIQV